jgi:shikimate kinase
MRFFIIGFKNSGKTTFGRQLAHWLQMDFLDLDEYIENKEQQTIPEIYTRLGDEKFRQLERKALIEVVKKDNLVISTGGGVPCHCDNMDLMEQQGEVIYLKVANQTLINRLSRASANRPIVKGKSKTELQQYVSDLRQKCEHHYLRARYVVDGDLLKW